MPRTVPRHAARLCFAAHARQAAMLPRRFHKTDELASSHCLPRGSAPGIVLAQPSVLEGAMSPLGQKQTCAVQKAMSALHPIATAEADMPQIFCAEILSSAIAPVCAYQFGGGGNQASGRRPFFGVGAAAKCPELLTQQIP